MERDAFRADAVEEVAKEAVEESAEKSVERLTEAERQRLGETGLRAYEHEPAETRFHVNPDDFEIFSQQIELEKGTTPEAPFVAKQLAIDETLGRMVGATAGTIEAMTGEAEHLPRAEHVIYLDKSARPVGWLVDEFWDEFTDAERPEKTHLAIDRKTWLKKPYVEGEIFGEEYIREPDGSERVAEGRDFHVEKVPREVLAGIRGLYIPGGIEDTDPEKIFATPTVLDGKDVLIVDEVSRSGSTIKIAKDLIRAAIPEVKSVNGHLFWKPGTVEGTEQMKSAPAWYNKTDSTGRGVRDINELYYKNLYLERQTPETRALMNGAFVLGEPLLDPENEPRQKSLRLRAEIMRMRREYDAGHILPDMTENPESSVAERMFEKLEGLGVEFVPAGQEKNNPRAYLALKAQRSKPRVRPSKK